MLIGAFLRVKSFFVPFSSCLQGIVRVSELVIGVVFTQKVFLVSPSYISLPHLQDRNGIPSWDLFVSAARASLYPPHAARTCQVMVRHRVSRRRVGTDGHAWLVAACGTLLVALVAPGQAHSLTALKLAPVPPPATKLTFIEHVAF